jgi:hypothetical protein
VNQPISYLIMGRLGKRTCPIDRVFDVRFNSLWKEWIEIKFKENHSVGSSPIFGI